MRRIQYEPLLISPEISRHKTLAEDVLNPRIKHHVPCVHVLLMSFYEFCTYALALCNRKSVGHPSYPLVARLD